MFSGIVQSVGHLVAAESRGGDLRLRIDATSLGLDDVGSGDSVCVGGVCLTAVAVDGGEFAADVSTETLARTTLGALAKGARVNLEKSLRLADRIGGHLVSGHVDAVGRVVTIIDDGRSQRWTFAIDRALARFVAVKGSICVDGVSLTVNGAGADTFEVTLIPHTLAVTTFGERRPGDAVNIEVDLVARYVARLLEARP